MVLFNNLLIWLFVFDDETYVLSCSPMCVIISLILCSLKFLWDIIISSKYQIFPIIHLRVLNFKKDLHYTISSILNHIQ